MFLTQFGASASHFKRECSALVSLIQSGLGVLADHNDLVFTNAES